MLEGGNAHRFDVEAEGQRMVLTQDVALHPDPLAQGVALAGRRHPHRGDTYAEGCL